MWSTPSCTARRRTASASSRSRGGPNTRGPASCIAPKPIRLIVRSPRSKVPAALTARTLLRPVAAEQVVGLHPLLGDDRRAQRQLAAEHGGGDDLGELAHLPGA